MKITIPGRSQPLTLTTVALLGLLAAGSALADTYIKGTQVSYDKSIDTTSKVNDSSVYVDEANDTNNKNFAEFSCEEGAAIFFLNSGQALYNQKEDKDETTPDLLVKVDGGTPIKMTTLSTEVEGKTNFNTLALTDKYDAQMLRLFQTAKSKIVLTVTRYDKKTLNFTFYTKGFNDGFKAINACQ